MLKTTLTVLALAAAALTYHLATPTPAACQTTGFCVSMFCGDSSQCAGSCVCAIPQGRATGHCVSTR